MSLRTVRLAAGAAFQDEGRPGWRKFGVPPGGAFDREAYALALALVGLTHGPVLEIPMMGGEFECREEDCLSLVGAECQVTGGVANGSFTVEGGQFLTIGPAQAGTRIYLASARGFVVKQRLGSGSGVEPSQVLASETPSVRIRKHRLESAPSSLTTRPIRVVAGPHARPSDLDSLAGRAYQVQLQSNRVGLRLSGGAFQASPELASEPSCLGAVQLTPSAELLIHGPDGPTIGGYPKIAVVINADLDRLAQLRPLESVQFEVLSLETAREFSLAHREALQRRLAMIRLAAERRV